jgi:oligoribonuclease (3'-5' exoribonuclease)
MTGLDLETDVIIEIFCVITNGNLEVLDPEGLGAVIHQSKETMDKMVPPPPLTHTHRNRNYRANGARKPTENQASLPRS